MSQMPIFTSGSDAPPKAGDPNQDGGGFSGRPKVAPAQRAEKPEDSHSAGSGTTAIRFSEYFFE